MRVKAYINTLLCMGNVVEINLTFIVGSLYLLAIHYQGFKAFKCVFIERGSVNFIYELHLA